MSFQALGQGTFSDAAQRGCYEQHACIRPASRPALRSSVIYLQLRHGNPQLLPRQRAFGYFADFSSNRHLWRRFKAISFAHGCLPELCSGTHFTQFNEKSV